MDVFSALSDPTRRELIRNLAEGPATATQLSRQFPISRQAITKHLAALDEAGLVDRNASGREIRYSLRTERLDEVSLWVAEVGASWDQRLAKLKDQIS
ncbi:MAG TPA: metalloregulator ArsR/SmtB family transcription factor [Acidimicrobiia bacterium]|jgi:DNA-binding transcriptional ArsR family regulator|nr:metalloregulator ArsR/SmtB family transcription factor [Acidimicrobiia bacterium]